MGFIRAAIWTALCVGLGIFVGTYELDGKTPLEHMQQEWKTTNAQDHVDKLVDGAKTTGLGRLTIAEPVEKISKADRDSLNSLIAKKSK